MKHFLKSFQKSPTMYFRINVKIVLVVLEVVIYDTRHLAIKFIEQINPKTTRVIVLDNRLLYF